MALSDLLQKIESDGKVEADAVLLDAKKKVASIEEVYKKKQSDMRAQYEKETAVLLEKEEKNRDGNDAREAKHIITSAKRRAIDEVFEDATTKLQELDEKAYAAFVKKSLTSIGSDAEGAVISSAPSTISLTESALKELGIKASVEKDEAIEGGFIVVGEGYEYDFTFARLLSTRRAELESEVADILFT